MITGGSTGTAPGNTDEIAPVLGPAEQRVVDALLACISRWGVSKTTVEDVAREAGISRATIYRLFPGGKDAMVRVSIQAEVARLVAVIAVELDATTSLEDCLTVAMSQATRFITENHAFSYLRAHEPESVESYLAFDRLDGVFGLSGTLVAASLERFLGPRDAYDVGVWAARLVVSYLLFPSDAVDLGDESSARAVVRTFLLPALAATTSTQPDPTSATS